MRQPPLARLGLGGRLVAAAALVGVLATVAVPVGGRVAAGVTAARFLGEFLSEGRVRWLSGQGRPPVREPLWLPGGVPADLWRPRRPPPYAAAVLVHGLTPEGKDDARAVEAAALLARGGLAVLVPDLPALRAGRLRPEDAVPVAAALRALAADPRVGSGGLTVVAVSVGALPAFRALAEDASGVPVRLVAGLGAHAEARELIRYFTTGVYRFGAEGGRRPVDPAGGTAFLARNLDLFGDPAERGAVAAALAGSPLPATAGPAARAVFAVLANRDPARVDALVEALPPEIRALLDAASPVRYVRRLPGRLLLVHGRDDPAVPYTEALRLAAAADPARTRLVLVGLLAHVAGAGTARERLGDLVRLWTAAYELFRG